MLIRMLARALSREIDRERRVIRPTVEKREGYQLVEGKGAVWWHDTVLQMIQRESEVKARIADALGRGTPFDDGVPVGTAVDHLIKTFNAR